jgi:ABC-2 type transport system ATP-binding protein
MVECRGASKRRRSRSVLTDIDLRLGVGVLGLLGPNGTGKTTLLSILATQSVATAG